MLLKAEAEKAWVAKLSVRIRVIGDKDRIKLKHS
jgi:hypothetical protein